MHGCMLSMEECDVIGYLRANSSRVLAANIHLPRARVFQIGGSESALCMIAISLVAEDLCKPNRSAYRQGKRQ